MTQIVETDSSDSRHIRRSGTAGRQRGCLWRRKAALGPRLDAAEPGTLDLASG